MLVRFLRGGGWILLLPLFVVVAALDAAHAACAASARLAASGVEARATITHKYERRRFVPGVRWRLLEPEHVLGFSYSSGDVLKRNFHVGLGEARVTREFFDRLDPGATTPLRYLPDDDEVFELEPGSHDREVENLLLIAGIIGALAIPLFLIVLRKARHTP